MKESREFLMIDKNESIAEEIRLMTGLKVDIADRRITVDTMAGKVVFSASEKTVMGNVYRFLNHYGYKLARYGLENKLKENQLTPQP